MIGKVIVEGLGLGLLLVLVCAVGISRGAVALVHLYNPEVQERCVALGLTTPERIRRSSILFKLVCVPGYMVYVLPTFLIKGLVALVAWKLCRKDQPLLALLSFLLAEAVMVLGYFLLEWALYGIASAAAAIGPNVVQGIAGGLIGMLCLLITPRLERVAKL